MHQVRAPTQFTYVLRFDRNGMVFEPSRYVSVGIRGDINMREYSVYSSLQDDYVEILVKEVDEGYVSWKLRRLQPGDEIEADGPFGFFAITPDVRSRGQVVFIATGTGISPFHCFARAYPDLDYRVLHAVRTLEDRYDKEVFDALRLTTCVGREVLDPEAEMSNGAGDATPPALFAGPVTDYLRTNPVSPETHCYLCGNCDMIYESFDILKRHGVPPKQLFAEVYF
ncbi:MAG: FAD-dependent oxidoreductase [Spirochaetia bacterium]